MKLRSDKFISQSFVHSSNSVTYTIVHNKGREPDTTQCQAFSEGIWKQVTDSFMDNFANSYGYFTPGTGSNRNQLAITGLTIHLYGPNPTIRFLLTWD